MATEPLLIGGQWRPGKETGTIQAVNPANGETLPHKYPISSWDDCDAALSAAAAAAVELESLPPTAISAFLESYADRLAAHSDEICAQANLETALPVKPRLADVEMPRTVSQLRQAAAAAREGTWRLATIDSANNIRSYYAAIGPVVVFGPNNFPLAFNGISGGDFAAAIAAGNPVIAKAHPLHPRTSQLMAEQAHEAAQSAGLPPCTVQLLYKTSRQDGTRLVSDSRLGAVAFTGSRVGGMALKAAADAVGKPIYLEMSSVNPVFFLPGALNERRTDLVNELAGSCLLGAGQFCTCPNLFVVLGGEAAEAFIADLKAQLDSRPVGTLLSGEVMDSLANVVTALKEAGAELVTGGQPGEAPGFSHQNTLLRVSGERFLQDPARLQTEAFGNATLAVVANGIEHVCEIAARIEGSLTGSLYSASDGSDDKLYGQIAPILRRRVGRLLNDKMPTGVAVSPAMNHGGPFPATGHPGFTAVGIPASLRRFAMLQCYDNIRSHRLPPWLQDPSPNGMMWRSIDGKWTQDAVPKA
ncbi:MAG TPA: aldehyde dehydrogenase (NADP(+)) [Lacipirellulaceae bacterium]